MGRRRIAIACQGGGSQCAFVAGALDKLFSRGIHETYDIVGLSGTSGGALTAALAWVGLLEHARGGTTPVQNRVLAFWNELTAQTPREIAFDRACVQMQRMVERGFLPSFATSPASLPFQWGTKAAAAWLGRPEFTDLGVILDKHIPFADLPTLNQPDSPVLLVGAADVLDGTFKVFSSARNEITAPALLASAAIPNLFPAVWVDGHAYWDGIFSMNPPITGFLRGALMNQHELPEEIWIVQVNRTQIAAIPERPSDVFDRRNQLGGNLSLQHELQVLDMLNMLLHEHALTDSFRARFGLDNSEPIGVRFIRMSEGLQAGLDYPSKLSRQPGHIAKLLEDGARQADVFLNDLAVSPGRSDLAEGAEAAIH